MLFRPRKCVLIRLGVDSSLIPTLYTTSRHSRLAHTAGRLQAMLTVSWSQALNDLQKVSARDVENLRPLETLALPSPRLRFRFPAPGYISLAWRAATLSWRGTPGPPCHKIHRGTKERLHAILNLIDERAGLSIRFDVRLVETRLPRGKKPPHLKMPMRPGADIGGLRKITKNYEKYYYN